MIHTPEVGIYDSADPYRLQHHNFILGLMNTRSMVEQPLLADQLTPQRATAERKRRIPWLAQPTKPNRELFAAVVLSGLLQTPFVFPCTIASGVSSL